MKTVNSPPSSIQTHALDNGLTFLYHQTPEDPLTACHLYVPNGVTTDPQDQGGLTTLLCSLLLKGTKKKKAKEIAEEMESLGIHISTGAAHDFSKVSLLVPSDYLSQSLPLFTEILFEPSFLPDEVHKEKRQQTASIQANKESIFNVAFEEFNTLFYGSHPYARPPLGTVESVDSLLPAHLFSHHPKIFSPQGALLSMASNLPYGTAKNLIISHFNRLTWPPTSSSVNTPLTEPRDPKGAETRTLTSRFEQSFLIMGVAGPNVTSADYLSLKIINAYLGGGMSGKLFQELREKEGLAYDVGSFFQAKKFRSPFIMYMGLPFSKIELAKGKIFRILNILRKDRMTPTELDEIKKQMKGAFILDHQTNSQRAHYLGWWPLFGFDHRFDQLYPECIAAITLEKINAVIDTYFTHPFITVEVHPHSTHQEN